MSRMIVVGLDIGSATVRVAVCELVRGSKSPRILALTKTESKGLRRGYVINADEAAAAIKQALKEAERAAGTRIRRVFVGLGGVTLESKIGESQIIVSRADAEITENDIDRALELAEANVTDLANGRILHTIPLGYKLDGKKVLGRPEGMRGNKLETRVLFIVYLEQHLENLIRAIESAKLTIEDIVAAPIAGSLPTLTTQQKNVGCILANIGSQTTALIVYEDGLPISLQVLPIGSMDVTNDIALGLRVPLDEAERLKLGSENILSLKKKLDEIIEARLSDMFELIEGHLKKIGRNGLLPAGILITGGGSQIADIEKLAKDALRLPAKVHWPNIIDHHSKNQIRDSGFLVAYGLCLFGLGTDLEETLTNRVIHRTKNKFLRWLKELLP
ncbi:MAG: cell division protein FtsA [Candidatus Vogelbacteria bacterium]|nr:cell division protein FtsA [Candidatus Vogelbacteria bacterium]